MYQSFEKLDVWKRSTALAVRVYEMLNGCRDFGLKDQMTRSAVSVPSNIAEGAERDSTKEFIRFLNIAKGSAAELRTQVYIAGSIGVLNKIQQEELISELTELSCMLHGLIKSQQKKLKN
jgi:four helix bundle protein